MRLTVVWIALVLFAATSPGAAAASDAALTSRETLSEGDNPCNDFCDHCPVGWECVAVYWGDICIFVECIPPIVCC